MKVTIVIDTYEWTDDNTKHFQEWLNQEKLNISDNTYIVEINKEK
jgi:hypothetical protein